MKYIILTLSLFMPLADLHAQRQARRDILAPIHQVFQAMAAGDSAWLAKSFHPNVRLATVTVDSIGNPSLRLETSLQPFKEAVARVGAGVFHEPIRGIRIRRRGSYAEVWAKYDFYLRGKFHHCGVDSFQLIRDSNGWKIIQLTDTRETAGCRPLARR